MSTATEPATESNQVEPDAETLAAAQVIEYLQTHPDFFARYPDLTSELELPHQSGEAVSLVEHQLAVLRERSIQTRTRLNELINNARANDERFAKVRTFTLKAMEAANLAELDQVLEQQIKQAFAADHLCCYLESSQGTARDTRHFHPVAPGDALPVPPGLDPNQGICGPVRADQYANLFGLDPSHVKGATTSAAIVPLGNAGGARAHSKTITRALVIGSFDPKHFTAQMDTLFLNFVGEVLERALLRLL